MQRPVAAGRGRGRPARISRERVVEAALEIGFQDLTMTRGARRLGVATSTLYYHVSSLDELRALAGDRQAQRLRLPLDSDSDGDLPFDADLPEGLYASAMALRAFFEASPGLAERCFVDGHWPQSVLALNERACRSLVAAGFEPAQAWLIVRAVADFVEGFVARKHAARRAGDSAAGPAPATRDPANYPTLAAALRALAPHALEARFEFGLRCVVEGVAQVPRRRDGRPGTSRRRAASRPG